MINEDDGHESTNICSVCKKNNIVNVDGVCMKCAPIFYAGMDWRDDYDDVF